MLLIVEDDPHYARIMVDLAHDHGLKVLVAGRGADALALARQYRPTAISLDVFLPDMLGWTVLSQLKQDPTTRHIPVQIVTLDEDRQHGLARGAFSFITKPTTTEGLQDALARHHRLRPPATQAPAGGGGQRGRAAGHHRTAGARRHRHRLRRNRRRGDRGTEARVDRLHRARSPAARHVRLRRAGPDPRRRGAVQCPRGRVHRTRALARGGRAACTRWPAASW